MAAKPATSAEVKTGAGRFPLVHKLIQFADIRRHYKEMREAFFLTTSISLPNCHCDSHGWTAWRLASASFLSPAHHPLATSAGCLAYGMGLLNMQRDRRLSANVVLYTAILVQ